MASYKLGVEVVSAHDLMPKDGQGSAGACVDLTFDGQRFRIAVKEKDLNPVWNERFYFNVSVPSNLPACSTRARPLITNSQDSMSNCWRSQLHSSVEQRIFQKAPEDGILYQFTLLGGAQIRVQLNDSRGRRTVPCLL